MALDREEFGEDELARTYNTTINVMM